MISELVEASAALPFSVWTLTAAVLFAALGGAHDAYDGRIPNGLTLSALALALLSRGWCEGAVGLLGSLAGALATTAMPFLLFRAKSLGGGDVKLFGALGAWLGPSRGLEVQLLAFVLLALGAVVILAVRGRLLSLLAGTFWLTFGWLVPQRWRPPRRPESLTSMRFGPAIALATFAICGLELGLPT